MSAPGGTTWEVVTGTRHGWGSMDRPAEENTLVEGPEDEARRVYADATGDADEQGYDYVRLRHDGVDVERWPQATGGTV
jgi:hypothetical protein